MIKKFQVELIKEAETYLFEIITTVYYVYIVEMTSRNGDIDYYIDNTGNIFGSLKQLRKEARRMVELKDFETYTDKQSAKARTEELRQLSIDSIKILINSET